MSDAREHELGLAAFVIGAKRERVLGFLSKDRTRRKLIDALPHFSDWDPACVFPVPSGSQTAEGVLRELTRRGARGTVHIVSTTRHLDGRDVEVADAIRAVVGSSSGTVVSCIAGKVAYFEGEEAGNRLILHRPG